MEQILTKAAIDEINQLREELHDMRSENERLQHVAQEILDGMGLIVTLTSPKITAIRMNLRKECSKIEYTGILQAFSQIQQRAAVLVECLGDNE